VRWLVPLAVAGCYGPVVPTGAPCAMETDCPDPLVCDRGHCERELSEIDASPLIDAPLTIDGNAGCACTTSTTIMCDGGAEEACALGCLALTDGARCAEVAPGNGVAVALTGVTGTISITGTAVFDTSTGEITGTLTRAPGEGVIGGVGFERRTFGTALLGVFTFERLSIGSQGVVELDGTRSAVFVVGTTATIQGTIDASAGCMGDRTCAGPGGGTGATTVAASGCGPGGTGQTDSSSTTGGDGGGGGGGGGAVGGAGGTAGSILGGGGGTACLVADNEPLVGGSGGGRGGAGGAPANPPRGGGGGGAFQLTARERITITGTITAGGAGGGGGIGGASNASAGAGGGAGGALLVEAPVVELAAGAVLAANGGGGGGGGSITLSGEAGQEGGANGIPAAGGAPVGQGSRGGAGGAGVTSAGTAADVSGFSNAGGGGGAVGRIYVRSVQLMNAGTTSPPAGSGPLRTR